MWANNCLQATPDYALLIIVAQVSGVAALIVIIEP
jgi:hypothetical protein